MLLAHALFKAALFLVVGVVDPAAGHPRPARPERPGPPAPGPARRSPRSRPRRWPGSRRSPGSSPRRRVFEALLHGAAADRADRWPAWCSAPRSPSPTRCGSCGAPSPPSPAWPATESAAPARRVFLPRPPLLAAAGRSPPACAAPARRAGRWPATPTPSPGRGPGYHLALWHGLTPAARAVARSRWPPAPALFVARGRASPGPGRLRLPVAGGTSLGLDGALDGPRRGRGHRRHPARLAAVLPRRRSCIVLVAGPGGRCSPPRSPAVRPGCAPGTRRCSRSSPSW